MHACVCVHVYVCVHGMRAWYVCMVCVHGMCRTCAWDPPPSRDEDEDEDEGKGEDEDEGERENEPTAQRCGVCAGEGEGGRCHSRREGGAEWRERGWRALKRSLGCTVRLRAQSPPPMLFAHHHPGRATTGPRRRAVPPWQSPTGS